MKLDIVKVSVVIPVYNAETYLKECLDSVLGQSLREIEVVCVDDDSTDASQEILMEYRQRDDRIVIIQESVNRGQAYARNLGMALARGKYIYFVDSDDVVKEDAMMALYHEAEKYGVDGVLFDADVIYDAGMEQYAYKSKRGKQYPGIYKGSQLFCLHNQEKDYDATVWRQFWRKTFLLDHGLKFCEAASPHEDLLFSFQATLAAERLRCISSTLYVYRRREGSSTANEMDEKRFWAMYVVYSEMVAFLASARLVLNDEEMSCIETFLASYHGFVRGRIEEMIKRGEDISAPRLKDAYHRIFLHRVFINRYSFVTPLLDKDTLSRIRKSKTVIVYGAGNVGREVMDLLFRHGITQFLIAVTKKDDTVPKYLNVYEFEELKKYRDDSIVLVAVGKRHQTKIINRLDELGFSVYLCMA